MFRVMLILGLLVLVPAAVVFWRMRDRGVVVSPPSLGSQKLVGTSTLNHGDPRPGKGVGLSPNRSE